MSTENEAAVSDDRNTKGPRSFKNEIEEYISSVKSGPGRGSTVLMGMSFEPEGHNWTNIVNRIVKSPLHRPNTSERKSSQQERRSGAASKPQTAGLSS